MCIYIYICVTFKFCLVLKLNHDVANNERAKGGGQSQTILIYTWVRYCSIMNYELK